MRTRDEVQVIILYCSYLYRWHLKIIVILKSEWCNYSRYRPCRLSLQNARSLIRHAPAVGQARIVFIVTYSPLL